ncbi:MAG TPA: GDP-mannose 4,6-dehydratase [Thermomicrobiales bacterium]|nr:GDP-mannose 4,6-dehydratase [Thermomicrobiales bacterium]
MTARAERVALITGAAGFAGRHLVAELEAETDWDIVGLSRKTARIGARARSVACDLLDRSHLDRVIGRYRPDVVFHLAAQSYVPKAFADPAATLSNNIVGQVNLFQALLKHDLRPTVVVVSSSEIYGPVEDADLPVDESAPLRPANPYAVSKAAQDLLGFQYFYSERLPVVRVRPFNHAGPGQSDRFVVSGFARQVAEAEAGKTEPGLLVGNLEAQRDFLDVRDVVRAYRLVADAGEPGEVYNIASGRPRSIASIVERLVAMATIPLEVRQDPARMRPADTPVIYGDATKLIERVGWQPVIPIEQTLADTLAYWRARV